MKNWTREQALKELQKRLLKRNLKLNLNEYGLYTDNIRLAIRRIGYWSYGADYDYRTVSIKIETDEYPHKRLRFEKFKILKGEYIVLINKIKQLMVNDKRRKKNNITQEQQTKETIKILREKLKKFSPRLDGYEGNSLAVKTKYFDVDFYVEGKSVRISLEGYRTLEVDTAIALLTLLK